MCAPLIQKRREKDIWTTRDDWVAEKIVAGGDVVKKPFGEWTKDVLIWDFGETKTRERENKRKAWEAFIVDASLTPHHSVVDYFLIIFFADFSHHWNLILFVVLVLLITIMKLSMPLLEIVDNLSKDNNNLSITITNYLILTC